MSIYIVHHSKRITSLMRYHSLSMSVSGHVADAKNPIQFATSAAAYIHPNILTAC